jgi:osmoprotectant transport system permease protein
MLYDAWTYILKNPGTFQAALVTHLWLSATALIVGTLVALPLGVALARRPRTALVIINFVSTLRTIPSLAVLAIMLPIFGTGFVPCAIALTIYAIPPILINA